MKNSSKIIKFWRALELFEPRDITRESSVDKSSSFSIIDSEQDLPWNQKLTKISIHQIYCGVIEIQKIISIFGEIFKETEIDDFSGQQEGKIAVFTFKADNFGQPITGSFTLSSAAWLLGKTLSSGYDTIDWLDGFDKASEHYSEHFDQRLNLLIQNKDTEKEDFSKTDSKSKKAPILFDEIINETRLICKNIGLENMVDSIDIASKSFEFRSSGAVVSNDTDVLNSFIQKDLGFVSKEVEKGNYGTGLESYLTDDEELNTKNRTDLKNSANILFEKLSPALFSSGRWAAKGLYPLAFSQQFAINSILENLSGNKSGVFSVNGPPGTGKTTMLKDVIAAIIVERAKTLAEFSDPAQAFKGKNTQWKSKAFEHWIAPVDNRLKNSGIVIASSNNGAVENVTKEFPTRENFDENWQKECEYFPKTASDLIGYESWGMIAATLGNSNNRNNFIQKFWFGENGFLEILKGVEMEDKPHEKSWEFAVKEFEEALEKESIIKHSKVEIYQQIQKKISLESNLKSLKVSKTQLENELTVIENQKQILQTREREFQIKRESLIREKTFNDNARPSLFSIIVSLGKTLKPWKVDDEKIQSDLLKIKNKIFDLEQMTWKLESESKEVNKKILQITKNLEETTQYLNEISKVLDKIYLDDTAQTIPKIDNWNDPSKQSERELSAPWFDEEWNLARLRVFAKALQLHKAFIFANAKPIKRNLSALIDVLSGKIQVSQKTNAAADVWATLFLVVPVVSTTFASFDKLFKTIGREEIGWLMIDEAGQAVPQAAVGAIWRSQRIIVVGDPLQLEPVSIIPDKMEKTLARKFDISDTWLPRHTSVQELADRVNKVGTYVKTNLDNKIWVGSPLRVHRRCLNPMFDISNKIAYDELMVYGTTDSSNYSDLPPSKWIDVQSYHSVGHWIEAEGRELEKLLNFLIGKRCSPQEIFLISPFAQVANKLIKFKSTMKLKAAGTIHTTQGKEAEVVILVLGGNPQKIGAKVWASSKPNLLNVAVSRAKKRIYIIGNRTEWSKYPYFGILDQTLRKN